VTWLHDASQAALAAAVMTLGLVMLLELRSIARLRRAVDCNLARVFEQLDLLRFENQQLIEAQTYGGAPRKMRSAASSPPAATSSATAASTHATGARPGMAATGAAPVADAAGVTPSPAALPAGEARLLATLAAARANRGATKAA
jgi:hypothetical protein